MASQRRSGLDLREPPGQNDAWAMWRHQRVQAASILIRSDCVIQRLSENACVAERTVERKSRRRLGLVLGAKAAVSFANQGRPWPRLYLVFDEGK